MQTKKEILKREAREMENDYSELEIRNIITVLLNDHREKLKSEEIVFLESIWRIQQVRKLDSTQRDLLLGMYDRMGEGGY